MERKLVQDVVPPKSIRNIPVSGTKKSARPLRSESGRPVSFKRTQPLSHKEKIQRRSHAGVWFVALVCVLVFAFSVTLLFAKAEVNVTPVQGTVTVDSTYTAKKTPLQGELGYTVMSLNKETEETLAPTGKEKIESKAKGTIIVYNSFSEIPQVLAKNTRFENTKGYIYRIGDAVSVPGRKKVNGQMIPGSVEVVITADVPGEAYNMLLKDLVGDFRIPGFKGGPKYEAFYGRLKTDIRGGASGTVGTVDEKTASETRVRMRTMLKDDLVKEAFAEKPSGAVLYNNSLIIEYESLPNKNTTDGKVAIVEKATLYGTLFDEKELASRILPDETSAIKKGETVVHGLDELLFDIKNKKDFNPKTLTGTLIFSLKGPLKSVAMFDENKLKQDLAGKPTSRIPVVLSAYQGIKTADVIIRPFWKRSFPGDPEKITIQTTVK